MAMGSVRSFFSSSRYARTDDSPSTYLLRIYYSLRDYSCIIFSGVLLLLRSQKNEEKKSQKIGKTFEIAMIRVTVSFAIVLYANIMEAIL